MPTPTESNQSSGTKPAIGLGPNRGGAFSQEDYYHPAAGWGAAISVSKVLIKQGELIDGTRAVFKMNHENGGYDCPGCAWPDDRNGLRMDICENGIKQAFWILVFGQSEAFSPAKRARLSRNYFVQLVWLSNIGILEDEGRRRARGRVLNFGV